jgi:hypothetical protein
MHSYLRNVALIQILQAGDESGLGMPTPWELLVVKPEAINNRRLQIDGYLKVSINNDGSFTFQIFSDRDSLQHNRDFKFLEIESSEFIKALELSKIKGLKAIQDLDRMYIVIEAKFEMVALTSEENLSSGKYRIGNLKGPLYCMIENIDKVIKNE